MRYRLPLLVLLELVVAACVVNTRPTVPPRQMIEFWQEPADDRRDLLYGPGGARLAPDPNDRYAMLKVEGGGFSPGYEVTDGRGRTWDVKLGPEARTEVVVSRIVWAMGYHQPYVYYMPRWTLTSDVGTRTEGPARFRLKLATSKNIGHWSWRNNPFRDTQPFAGLFVLMTIVNNWDLKSAQNAVYQIEDGPRGILRQYVLHDLGASLGKTNWWLPGSRDDIEGFEREPFIKSVSGNRVKFHFQGAWLEPQLTTSISPADVRWMCERLARLTADEWREAFRAGGYSDAQASRFIHRLLQKIDEGLGLAPAPR